MTKDELIEVLEKYEGDCELYFVVQEDYEKGDFMSFYSLEQEVENADVTFNFKTKE